MNHNRNHNRRPRKTATHTAPNYYDVELSDGSCATVFATTKAEAYEKAVSFKDALGPFYLPNQRPISRGVRVIEFQVGDNLADLTVGFFPSDKALKTREPQVKAAYEAAKVNA